jgi:hypothetical protein
MREVIGYTGCGVTWFHQGENKQARILSQATNVMNSIIFPHDWQERWPQFAKDTLGMSRMAKWIHEDNADMLTGIVEKSLSFEIVRVYGSYNESAIIDQSPIDPKETIFIAQDLADGFFRPVTCVIRDKQILVIDEFEPSQMIDAPGMVREKYPNNEIVWYLDISIKDVFPSYRQSISSQGIILQAGTIIPSPLERPIILNKLFIAKRLKIMKNCDRIMAALASRTIDKNGNPECGDGPSGLQYICGSLEYCAYRLVSANPQTFGVI